NVQILGTAFGNSAIWELLLGTQTRTDSGKETVQQANNIAVLTGGVNSYGNKL
ncbi:hypothetical protein ACJX0J_011249, partial [Zea mays]